MNSISNVWNHPRTSAAGLLIAIVTTAGVLGQQGVHLGHAGTGTVVTLVGALASALLGLLARDPASAASTVPTGPPIATGTLGVWALIALLLPLPFSSGCSGISVAQDIVNWTPALQTAVATVDSTAALLAPADAPVFAAATAGFDAATNLLANQARTYLANPSASALAKIQTQVVAFQQQVNAALLQAARIVDGASQKHALAAIQAVAVIVGTLVAMVQSISSKAAVAQMAADSPIKLASVRPYFDREQAAKRIAAHYGEATETARIQVTLAQQRQSLAGL